jgi:hypothetical protein
MKTIKILSLSIIVWVIILSCQKQETNESAEIKQAVQISNGQTTTNGNRTIEFFKANLTSDMSYDQIVKRFGKPDGDLGSGFHIYFYDLSDGTQVRIVYVYDKIQAAVQVDPKEMNPDKILATII